MTDYRPTSYFNHDGVPAHPHPTPAIVKRRRQALAVALPGLAVAVYLFVIAYQIGDTDSTPLPTNNEADIAAWIESETLFCRNG